MLKFQENDNLKSLPSTNFKQLLKYLGKERRLENLLSYYMDQLNFCDLPQNVEYELLLQNMLIKDFVKCLDALQYEAPLVLFKSFENVKVIKEPPEEFNANVDTSINIECQAIGFPKPIYQWFLGKKLLKGQNKPLLCICNAKVEDEGFYICRLHNNGHKNVIFSRWCKVTVNKPVVKESAKINYETKQTSIGSKSKCQAPRITRHPVASLRVDENASFSLNCCALGLPHPNFQWFKDHEVIIGSTHPTFNVERAKLGSEGSYQCKVWNEFGIIWSVESQVKVTPQKINSRLPEIVHHPQSPSEKIIIGSSIILGCRAVGDEPLHYEWYRNSTIILGAETNELKFVNLQSDLEEGAYQCRVYNSFGSALSKPAIIRLDSIHEQAQFTASAKIALLIGNYNYPTGLNPLATVENDTKVLEKHLNELGFYVYSFLNLNLGQMKCALEFLSSFLTSPRTYCLFFFGGHGFEKFGKSYLVPVDVDPTSFGPADCLCVEREVLARLQFGKKSQHCAPAFIVILLDICRQEGGPCKDDSIVINSSKDEGDSYATRGEGIMGNNGHHGGGNYVFGYATSSSSQAYEMEGQVHSIFMTHLFKHISKPVPLEEVLRRVRESVHSEPLSRNTLQFPEIKTNLSRSFSLADKVVPAGCDNALEHQEYNTCGLKPQNIPSELIGNIIRRSD